MTRRRRRIIAIMFTDMSSYSVKMARNDQLALELLDLHNRILTPIIERNGGAIVKHIGDAIMGRFDDCQSAFRTGLQVQASIGEYNLGRPEDTRIAMRIGIHVGEVVEMDKDIFGHAVNLASRIQQLGSDGDVIATRQARDLVSPSPEFRYEFLQSATVKNIDAPIDLFRVLPGSKDAPTTGRLIIVSGPPGAGKDVVASLCREELIARDIYCGYLKRYTTWREESETDTGKLGRSYEPRMADTTLRDRSAFEGNPDVFFPYEKYGSCFGFSKSHLQQRGPYSALLLCIFDDLERLGEFRQAVQQASGREAFVIYLSASEQDLKQRLLERSTPDHRDQKMRLGEIDRDLSKYRISLGRCRRHIDMVIQNGRLDSLDEVVRKAVGGIIAHMAGQKPES